MQFFKASTLLCTALFLTTVATTAQEANQVPELVITTIQNTTSYDLGLVDRLAEPGTEYAWYLPARSVITLNLRVDTANKIILNGNLADIMEETAQYVFVKLDQDGKPVEDQEVYLNLHLSPGGKNNGNGITTGSLGSIALNFYVAGKQGGCMMNSCSLKNPECSRAEFELLLEAGDRGPKNDLFRLNISGSWIEL